MTDTELRVRDAIESRREDLVELAGALIGFDTTARQIGDPPREEGALQAHLAGSELRVPRSTSGEPDGEELQGKPLVPPGCRSPAAHS